MYVHRTNLETTIGAVVNTEESLFPLQQHAKRPDAKSASVLAWLRYISPQFRTDATVAPQTCHKAKKEIACPRDSSARSKPSLHLPSNSSQRFGALACDFGLYPRRTRSQFGEFLSRSERGNRISKMSLLLQLRRARANNSATSCRRIVSKSSV